MLMRLGPVAFEVAPLNAHSIEYSAAADFAEKPVVGAMQPLEFVGEGANSWTIEGRIFPARFGGESAVARLHQMRAGGQPQYLMRGDGKPLGWVVLETLTERASYLDGRGVGQVIELSISVRRSRGPANGSFFSIITGVMQ